MRQWSRSAMASGMARRWSAVVAAWMSLWWSSRALWGAWAMRVGVGGCLRCGVGVLGCVVVCGVGCGGGGVGGLCGGWGGWVWGWGGCWGGGGGFWGGGLFGVWGGVGGGGGGGCGRGGRGVGGSPRSGGWRAGCTGCRVRGW